ncbi:hypothetical protein [Microbacterium sp. CIAB417]|uniref:hypothetical protein n=1 Tax=Microbacterium sp. CIAB417 TaxID=2860287 RepID=UPI001FAD5A7C|nr:hypothetical protein [Microbacterium sp. CIAB417]
MRIAFAGVAHSHPFADAANLVARGAEIAGVWDADDPARLSDFSMRFAADVHEGLDGLLAIEPDVVVVTVRTPRAAAVALACADAGVPAFFNKTVAADPAGLERWASVSPAARFTSSVLRFAPALEEFAAGLRGMALHAIEVHAQHDIAGFLSGDRAWQDDPAGAGGTMINIGVHAWEMLDVLMPGADAEILSAVRTYGAIGTASEVLGSVHARVGETAVTVTVSGVSGSDRYALRVWTDDGIRDLVLPDDSDGLGYGGAADAILRLGEHAVVPVAPDRTLAVYRNTIASAAAARGRRPLGRRPGGRTPAPDRGGAAEREDP